ncbi:calcium-binding protein, partial [Variovorax sp. 770b2]|uniref:calcium-binding protein n=1 Tax=Variovorax sp. 770b2 TaxID=1566271 RepID=UPI0008E8DAA1
RFDAKDREDWRNVINDDGTRVLTGSAAMNTLKGYAGSDTLDGKEGDDLLSGGAGNDTYVMGRGYGVDRVDEDDATTGNADVAVFDASVDQLWFRQIENDLEVSLIGTGDKLVVNDWYLGSQHHVEQFKSISGKTLMDSQVQNLVQAMASFAPPAAGQTALPANYQASLMPIIAANWH